MNKLKNFQNLSNEERRKYLITSVAFLLIMALVFTGYDTWKKSDELQQRIDSTNMQIGEVNDALKGLKKEDDVMTKDEAVTVLTSVLKIGQDVANEQNRYKTLDDDIETQLGEIEDISGKIGVYFEEDTKSQTARTPWYQPNKTEGLRDYKWDFLSNYSFTGKNLDVIWVAKDNTGDIFAYSTAMYDSDTKLFSKFNTSMTRLGEMQYEPEDEGHDATENLNNLIDSIRGPHNEGSGGVDPSSPEDPEGLENPENPENPEGSSGETGEMSSTMPTYTEPEVGADGLTEYERNMKDIDEARTILREQELGKPQEPIRQGGNPYDMPDPETNTEVDGGDE